MTATGGTMLWPMIALSNIAQGSSVLAMSVLQKKNERALQVNVPALISCYLGVTEPALFGVNLKYGFPLVCGMIGSAFAALISVGFGVEAASIGVGGLPGILSIFPQFWVVFLAAMAVAAAVPFLLVCAVGSRKLSREERFGEERGDDPAESGSAPADAGAAESESAAAAPPNLKAFLSGRTVPLECVPDEVFSQHVMGDGLAIEPTDSTVVAPADGEVSVVMEDSRHACGLTLENGMEVLIHVGIDTVNMQGEGFELLVKQGQKVRCGQPLLRFDPDKIQAAGYPTITVFVVTDEGDAKDLQFVTGADVKAGETDIVNFQ